MLQLNLAARCSFLHLQLGNTRHRLGLHVHVLPDGNMNDLLGVLVLRVSTNKNVHTWGVDFNYKGLPRSMIGCGDQT